MPLPDGRRIPVDLRAPKMSAPAAAPQVTQVNFAPVIQIPAGATPDTVDAIEKKLIPRLEPMVDKRIVRTFDRKSRFSRSGI